MKLSLNVPPVTSKFTLKVKHSDGRLGLNSHILSIISLKYYASTTSENHRKMKCRFDA